MALELDNDWVGQFGDWYQRLGPETRDVLIDLLPADWSFEGKRVLDFGSGPGRTLRHFLPEAESCEFWAADIDPVSIEMLNATICPPMHSLHCEPDPPLGLEHGSFDLIWSISVFTHLTDNSLAWLLELHRLLKPGGMLIATTIGRQFSEMLADEPWDEDQVGRNVLRHNQPMDFGGPMVLMSDWWVRARWGRGFEILEIASDVHAMNWVVMRRRDVELTLEELARPEDDPREYQAMLSNLRQVQRELEWSDRKRAEEIAALRDQYERSRSWRLTRPFRAAGQRARAARAKRSA